MLFLINSPPRPLSCDSRESAPKARPSPTLTGRAPPLGHDLQPPHFQLFSAWPQALHRKCLQNWDFPFLLRGSLAITIRQAGNLRIGLRAQQWRWAWAWILALPLCSWASYLTSLCLSCHIYEMGIIIVSLHRVSARTGEVTCTAGSEQALKNAS